MKKTLVIVESPAKAKTIAKYLGPKYQLAASVGHIRNLPASTLGIDTQNGYKPLYVIMQGKEKVVKELKDQAKNTENVLIATDPDREGEAIAWHLAKILKIEPSSLCRISFNEITKNSITKAVKEPKQIDMNLVNSQQARRLLDRLVGYELSPLMWKKIKRGISAGRVQSVATRMIVDREEEINNFKPEEYWYLDLIFKLEDDAYLNARFYGILNKDKIKKVKLSSSEEVEKIVTSLEDDAYLIHSIDKKERKRKAFPPFTTSTLQQDAARKLGFSSKKTMSIAQQLYEGITLGEYGLNSLVTYIRTDSVRISETALKACRDLIKDTYGSDYLPAKANFFKNKNSIQDAHEAIRPAHFELNPTLIKEHLTADQFKLYNLIWNRFISSQMKDAIFEKTQIDIINKYNIFRTTGEVIIFPGFLIVNAKNVKNKSIIEENLLDQENIDNFDNLLPKVDLNTKLSLVNIDKLQKFTLPPARYNEASLIKAMEEEGIGRPSTYAPTLHTIQERNYVVKKDKNLVPTSLGITTTNFLKDNFSNIVNLKFTANLESQLDTVEDGTTEWIKVLDNFYPDFHKTIEEANTNVERYNLPVEKTEEKCPVCQNDLVFKEGRYGKFIACSSFPTCTYTQNIKVNVEAHCPLCDSNLEIRKTKRGKIFYVCDKKGDNSACPFISWDLPLDGSSCSVCNSYMVKKKFRNKIYVTCSNTDCASKNK